MSSPAPTASRKPVANGRSHRRRPWIPYALAALVALILIAGFQPRPVPVETARVARGPLRATVDEEGRTRVRHRFVVSAPVAGLLRRIPFKAGAEVEAGRTVLAVIDPIPSALLDARSRSLAEARRDTARANLAKAQAAHQFASADLRRFEQLFRENTVSQQELEGSQWREAAAAKELAAAESALRQAEAELAEFIQPLPGVDPPSARPVEVLAPAGGRILRVIEENARVVTPGTPLLEVGDPRDLEVVIDVLSRDGAALAPGARITLDQWGGSQPLEARVRLVEPAAFTKISALGVEEQRVNIIADLLTPPEERPGLGDGYRVEAKIVVWEAPDALKVPAGALFRRGNGWAAFGINRGRAELRKVEVGRSSGLETQIQGGLNEGDTVILYPGDRVRESLRVRPVDLSP